MNPQHIAVIDIGKTNVKLVLVETAGLSEVDVITRPNTVLDGPPYPHYDVEAIWQFLLDGLAGFHASHGVDAISVTTHGAAAALIASDGALAAPVLDYEFSGPDDLAEDYNTLRPPFRETGSPRLPMGLNLGAQLHWQFARDPALHDRTKAIVTLPQYWGYRLTGQLACDLSSLGCHTDLWNPFDRCFSSLVATLDLGDKMAPARPSTDVLGQLAGDVARRTGLNAKTPVSCGIHDSNASLLPHVMSRSGPFSVVSSGTWVIVLTVGGAKAALDPERDTLVNVNALGEPVPSARFMGGREYEILLKDQTVACSDDDLLDAAINGPLLMPAAVPESGPFQGWRHHWVGAEPDIGSPLRAAAVSYYLAMMTSECLSLTGQSGPVIVEGPFGANVGFCRMLAAATNCEVVVSGRATGTSMGAAMLMSAPAAFQTFASDQQVSPSVWERYKVYATRWRDALDATWRQKTFEDDTGRT